MREFPTGATRDDEGTKNDYRGFISPQVWRRFGDYMTEHRTQADGKVREPDNWKKGMPRKAYLSSLIRHTVDLWALLDRETPTPGKLEANYEKVVQDLLCAVIFNAQGLLYERLLGRDVGVDPEPTPISETLAFEEFVRNRARTSHNPGAILAHLNCAEKPASIRTCYFYEDFRKAVSGVQK